MNWREEKCSKERLARNNLVWDRLDGVLAKAAESGLVWTSLGVWSSVGGQLH